MIGHAARRALRCLAQHAATRALSAAAPLPLLPPWPSATAGLEVAVTLPAAYYTHPAALQLELERVLYNSWQVCCAGGGGRQPAAAAASHNKLISTPPAATHPDTPRTPTQMVCDARSLPRAGDYRCGSLGDVRWLLVRGEDGALRAFHNVRCGTAALCRLCRLQHPLRVQRLCAQRRLWLTCLRPAACACARRCAGTTPPPSRRATATRSASSAHTTAGLMVRCGC